jgi:hypothetical protein
MQLIGGGGGSIVSRETSPMKKQFANNNSGPRIIEASMGDIEYDDLTIDVREQDNNSDVE